MVCARHRREKLNSIGRRFRFFDSGGTAFRRGSVRISDPLASEIALLEAVCAYYNGSTWSELQFCNLESSRLHDHGIRDRRDCMTKALA
jgi:hypothetical protein